MCKYTPRTGLPENDHCPECGCGSLYVFYVSHDDKNGITDYMAHCEECDCDWQWMEYFDGCERTGRTVIDRTPIARKWWG